MAAIHRQKWLAFRCALGEKRNLSLLWNGSYSCTISCHSPCCCEHTCLLRLMFTHRLNRVNLFGHVSQASPKRFTPSMTSIKLRHSSTAENHKMQDGYICLSSELSKSYLKYYFVLESFERMPILLLFANICCYYACSALNSHIMQNKHSA